VTFAQFASLVGMPQSTLANYRARDTGFPQPAERIGRTASYRLEDVHAYAADRGWKLTQEFATPAASLGDLPTVSAAVIAGLGAVEACRADSDTEAVALSDLTAARLIERVTHLGEPWSTLVTQSGITPVLLRALGQTPDLLNDTLQQARDAGRLGDQIDHVIESITRNAAGRIIGQATSPALASWVWAACGQGSGVIVDPACGLGLVLVGAAATRPTPPSRVFGLDQDPDAVLVSALRSLAHGQSIALLPGDALAPKSPIEELRGQADLVVLDAPAGAYPGRGHISDSTTGTATEPARRGSRPRDPRKAPTTFGIPPVNEQAFRWIALAYDLLRPGGRAVVLAPMRTLDSPGRGAAFREAALGSGAVTAVVSLPRGLRPGSAPEIAMWVLDKPSQAGPRPVLTVAGGTLAAQVGPLDAPEVLRLALAAYCSGKSINTASAADEYRSANAALSSLAPLADVDPTTIRVIPPQAQRDGCDLTPWSPLARPMGAGPINEARSLLGQVVEQLEDIRRMLDHVDEPRETDPSEPISRTLADLLGTGEVAAYELTDPYGARLRLVDPAAFRSPLQSGHLWISEPDSAVQEGDVLVSLHSRHGRVDVRTTILHGDQSHLLDQERELVVLRITPGGDLAPEALRDAIQAQEMRTWPMGSRGPLDLIRACSFIVIPASQRQRKILHSALRLRAQGDQLLDALLDPLSWD